MFYYDENGDLSTTKDPEERQRMNALTMLKTTSYGLKPEAAGRLQDLLGDVDPSETEQEARRRLQQALETMGLGDTDFSVVVSALDEGWQAKIEVGE